MEKLKITTEIREKLRADFPENAYSQHPTKSFLTTLKAMYIVERLNDVFGIGRWTLEHNVELATDNYILLRGKLILLDYDCEIPDQFGGHPITGKNTEIADGYKSAVTDILSKSASYLEIGIDMFKGKIKVKEGTDKKDDSKIKFGWGKELPWLNEKQFNGMCEEIRKGNSQIVIDAAKKYKAKNEYKKVLNEMLTEKIISDECNSNTK